MGAGRSVSIGAIVLVAGTCVFGAIAYRRDKARYSGLENACSNLPVPGTPAYVPGSAATRLLAYTRNATGTWTWALTMTPQALYASSRAEASLVVCAEPPRTVVVGRCSVTSSGGPGIGIRVLGVPVASIGGSAGTTIYERTQQELPVRVVEAATGRVRIQEVIQGSEPRACEGTATGLSQSDFRGGAVNRERLAEWLAPRLAADR